MSQIETVSQFNELITRCDSLLKEGKSHSVQGILRKTPLNKVPRSVRQPLAKICRRAGLIDSGLRLLSPVMRSERLQDAPPSAGEVCEYAMLLSGNGSVDEALGLLASVNPSEAPEALQFTAFCHITKWDYVAAAAILEAFLKVNQDKYAELIASVNLCAAYLAIEDLDRAGPLLAETMERARAFKATRLMANLMEQTAHYHFLRRDLSRAKEQIDHAFSILGGANSYDELLLLKWRAILKTTESNDPSVMLAFREVAVQRCHWESVREADLFALKAHFDQDRFDHLYYGSPMPAYRQRILRMIPNSPSARYLFGDKSPRCILDLASGHFSNDQIHPGGKLHRAFAALLTDFYVPRNTGVLFAAIYPDEYFNILTSAAKVKQIIHRMRDYLLDHSISAEVIHQSGGYRFLSTGSFAVALESQTPQLGEGVDFKWARVVAAFSAGTQFTVTQACARADLSVSGFHRLARWAQAEGVLKRDGSGKRTTYEIIDSQKAKKAS